jgi:hypothetical protein
VLRESRNILEPLLPYQAKPHNMALVALQQQILSAVNEHDESIRMQNHEKRSLKMFSPKWYSLLKAKAVPLHVTQALGGGDIALTQTRPHRHAPVAL